MDDEPLVASTLAAILQANGYAAWSFTDPLQAMETALLEPPDVLVSDLIMPTISGVELASQVTSLYPSCRIFLYSSQADLSVFPQDATPPIIPKPIHPTALLAIIKQELVGGEVGRLLIS